jgi:predicted nucleic acid-binding protein
MKISTVREFRDNATGYLRSKDPILVTRRGRLAGVFFPRPEASLPVEFKRELSVPRSRASSGSGDSRKKRSWQISSRGGRGNVRLVADANVLLAAVLGGRAKAILQHPEIDELLTAEPTLAEVQEYAVILARKRRLSLDALLLAVAALPVTVVEQATYSSSLPQARKLIANRDPDDVDVLALHGDLPVWSNDNDFEETGIEWYTTAELLQKLGISESTA